MQNPSPSVQEKRDHATVLAELKQRVRRLERRPPAADAGGDADLDLGHAAIDRCLPEDPDNRMGTLIAGIVLHGVPTYELESLLREMPEE